MKKIILASAALLVLVPVLALAQERTPPAGATTVGTATPRGGESSGSSGSTSGSSAGSMGSDRGGGNFGMGGSSGFSGGSPANVASGRYDGPRSGDSASFARPRSSSPSVGQPVPASERPRGDRPTYGQATPRANAKPPQNIVIGTPSDFYYDPYFGYGGYGYYPTWYWPYGAYTGFYDPWMMAYPMNPWSWAVPYGAYSTWYDYYSSGYGGAPSYVESTTGSIRLKVVPKEAEVYVDGTFYGQVDRYNGTFQHLDLKAGTHTIEIKANGYEPLKVPIRVLPGKTITYSGELKPIK